MSGRGVERRGLGGSRGGAGSECPVSQVQGGVRSPRGPSSLSWAASHGEEEGSGVPSSGDRGTRRSWGGAGGRVGTGGP